MLQSSHVDNSISNPMGFANTNVLGTMNLLNYALKNNINRFIHISTDEVYGSSESGYFSENEKFNPRRLILHLKHLLKISVTRTEKLMTKYYHFKTVQ